MVEQLVILLKDLYYCHIPLLYVFVAAAVASFHYILLLLSLSQAAVTLVKEGLGSLAYPQLIEQCPRREPSTTSVGGSVLSGSEHSDALENPREQA